jgi:hypothetical protein
MVALKTLISDSENNDYPQKLLDSHACTADVIAMKKYERDLTLVNLGCLTICDLAKYDAINSAEETSKAIDMIVGIIKNPIYSNIAKSACLLVIALAFKQENKQKLNALGMKGFLKELANRLGKPDVKAAIIINF